ncbi:MAG: alpha/beta fold hydrolase [Candidatus Sumerlaeaceae bacterium]|nr:alpha/beta fold hydrolase [Candidatus Sumerlaeaceae bacterium]
MTSHASKSAPADEMVFLLHGIGKPAMDMKFVDKGLRKAGYETFNWRYPSRKKDIAGLADELAEVVEAHPARKISFVAHSMGGIIVRAYLQKYNPPNVGRFVMIGTPNQGAQLADWLSGWIVFRLWFGPAGLDLRQGDKGACTRAGIPTCEFGIIAGGTGKKRGMNPLLPGDNDGTVTVDSTRLPGAKDFLLVPYPHPVIHYMPKTVKYTIQFLQSGQFRAAN